jgi:hypothetical protein
MAPRGLTGVGGASRMNVSTPYLDPKQRHKRTADWLVLVRGVDAVAVHRFSCREDAEAFADNAAVPRMPRAPNAEQAAALERARKAQRQFEQAQLGLDRASHGRAVAFRAALDAGLTYGQLADAFGWARSSVQAAVGGRERKR